MNIIDINDSSSIIDACKKSGFFYMPCDEEDNQLLSELTKFTVDYFDQTLDSKNQNHVDNTIGYVKDRKKSSRYEYFVYRKDEIKHQKEDLFNKYISKLNKYGETIFMALMNSVFPDNDKTKDYLKTIYPANSTLMLSHYTNVQSNENKGTFGLAEHTDWGLITILYTTKEGLEIFQNDKWVKVPIIKNHYVINIADVVEILSNGTYKSTIHRVITNYDKDGQDKYSIVHFFDPDHDFVAIPYNNDTTKYKSIKYRDLMKGKYKIILS